MEVNINADTEAKLARLAAERGRDIPLLVQEAIENLVAYDEWFIREVEAGIQSADRREFVDHGDVKKLIDKRYPG